MPRSKRLTKEQLSKEADIQLRDNARGMLSKWFVAVNSQIEKGDNRTIEMVGRMFQFDKGPGGITIFNQHLQVNQANSDAPSRVKSFDQIIAKLEERDAVQRQLAAPLENSEEEDDDEDSGDADDIPDAEIEELPVSAE
jgi:hypothetical protein